MYASSPNYACYLVYIGDTSQPLQHRCEQHYRSGYTGNDSAVFKHLTLSGHDVHDSGVSILDRENSGLNVD